MNDKPASMDMLVDIRRIDGLIQRRQLTEARTTCDAFLMRHPDRAEGWLLLGTLSEGGADRFRKRFLRSFGLKLIPFSPLDWVDTDLGDITPTPFVPREEAVHDAV